MALLIREKFPTKWLIEWEIIKITVWTFMVSELIQDLDKNFGPNKRFQFTKVLFISKKETFLETLKSVSSIRTHGLRFTFGTNFRGKQRGKLFGQYDSFRKFSMQRIENHRVPLTFQATAFQYFWSIEFVKHWLHSLISCKALKFGRRVFNWKPAYSWTIIWTCSISPKIFYKLNTYQGQGSIHVLKQTLYLCNCYSRFKVSRVSLRACRSLTELAERVLPKIPPQQHFRFFRFTLACILSLETDCDMLCYF